MLHTGTLVLACAQGSFRRSWILMPSTRQLSGAEVKLLPVMLTGGVPPAILADLQYADFTKNRAEALRNLLRAIR